ncbi:MAG: enoyl-CoA hydratase/isomerase family protein [Nannocystaceae bacterium]
MPVLEATLAPGLLRWTLSNPARRNAVDPEMLGWIEARSRALSGEVVLLTGEGQSAFSAGFDLHSLRRLQAERPGVAPDQPLIDASTAIQAADATFVAALNGYAIGAGVELAAACDLRIARSGVTFQVPAGKLGVVYHAAGIRRFHAVFGPALTRRLLLAGEAITAEEALSAGALAAVVEADALDEAAVALCGRLSAGDPRSLRAHRDLLRAIERTAVDPDPLRAHADLRAEAYAAADLDETRRRALGRES